jgi:hypothetical protein
MATREPTARSNPPPMTTKAWPKDTNPKAAALAMTRIRFVGLMNTPREMTVAMTRTATNRKSRLWRCRLALALVIASCSPMACVSRRTDDP